MIRYAVWVRLYKSKTMSHCGNFDLKKATEFLTFLIDEKIPFTLDSSPLGDTTVRKFTVHGKKNFDKIFKWY